MTTINTLSNIILDKKLSKFIVGLNKEAYFILEENILANGCREPLTVWIKDDVKIVVDGHHRYEICMKHNIPFSLVEMTFANEQEAKDWMINNQLGRRNLTSDQISYYRGLKYLSLVNKKGGYKNASSKGHFEPTTAEILAEKYKISESTIKRDSKFAEGLTLIGKSNTDLLKQILNGESGVKRIDINAIAQAKGDIKIKNEADLYNKAKIIRDEILNEVEISAKKLDQQKVEQSQEMIQEKEPLFLERSDRLAKIKGMIMSALNRAIRNNDIDAINELKHLINKLEFELMQSEQDD